MNELEYSPLPGSRPAPSWVGMYAAWAPGPTAAMIADPGVRDTARAVGTENARDYLADTLKEADALPIGPVVVSLVGRGGDWLLDAGPVVEILVAEVEAIRLTTPNPFPLLIVVRRPHPWPHVAALARTLASVAGIVAGTALVLLGALLTAYYVTRALAR